MRWRFLLFTPLLALSAAGAKDPPPPSGDAVVRGRAGPSDIVVTTTTRLAGAIHSVTWGGKEFIDSGDHGRQLQSAAAFGATGFTDFYPETNNPTEAGARRDSVGPRSSSRLVGIVARGNELTTIVRPAYWLAPGERDETGHPARNAAPVSDVTITKQVTVGYKQFAHALDYRVTFAVPPTEKATAAQFEALTGYMPGDFAKFWALDPAGGLGPLSDGPGEQGRPVVVSTADGRYAMGVWSPDQPSKGFEAAGYGRFRFPASKVVKWNCVFRVANPAGVKPGNYAYRMFVAVGSLQNVRDTLAGLMGSPEFKK